jgi:hypothetical protein
MRAGYVVAARSLAHGDERGMWAPRSSWVQLGPGDMLAWLNLLTREEKKHIINTKDLRGPEEPSRQALRIRLPRMVWSRSLSTSS